MAKTSYEYIKAWRARPENKHKRAEEAARWRAKNPQLMKEIKKRHRAKHIDEIRVQDAERARKKRAADPDGQRRRMQAFLERKGVEQERIAGRPKPDVCEECGGNHLRVVFDHCHTTGNFRGWLCDRCNKTLGMVKDDPDLLDKLSAYLRRNGYVKTEFGRTKSSPKERVRDPRQTGLSLE